MKLVRNMTIVLLLLTLFTTFAHGTPNTKTEVILFEDGSYLIIEVTSIKSRVSDKITGSKTYRHYNALGTEKWYVTLYGTFTYDGATSVCMSSNTSIGIFDSAWYIVSNTYTTSGNSAIGKLIMGYKLLGVTADKKTVDMLLTCDANGNLS